MGGEEVDDLEQSCLHLRPGSCTERPRIDADLRRPSQHKIFGASNSRGLTDYLSKGVAIDDLVLATSDENLKLIPSESYRLEHSDAGFKRMTTLIEEVREKFEDMVRPWMLRQSWGWSDSYCYRASRSHDCACGDTTPTIPSARAARVKSAVLNTGGNLLGVVLNNGHPDGPILPIPDQSRRLPPRRKAIVGRWTATEGDPKGEVTEDDGKSVCSANDQTG